MDAMLPLVYDELRRLAYNHMAGQAAQHTLQPTALVHEAWIKLARGDGQQWDSKASFLSVASTAMRHILIDHARKKLTQKREGNLQRIELTTIERIGQTTNRTLLLVNDALEQLEQTRPEWARIVEMKYFGGMTNREVADVMKKGESTIERYWAGAKAWLHKQLILSNDCSES